MDISRKKLVFGNVSVEIRVTSEDYIDSDGRMIQLVSQRGFLVLSIQIFSDLTSAWDQIKLVSSIVRSNREKPFPNIRTDTVQIRSDTVRPKLNKNLNSSRTWERSNVINSYVRFKWNYRTYLTLTMVSRN